MPSGRARHVLFVDVNIVFAPAEDRGWYRRYTISPKRCVRPEDRVLLETFVEERPDGRFIGVTHAFRRMGGHLEGGLYRRYLSIVESIGCPCCKALPGELCTGVHGRWWGNVHKIRSKFPNRNIRDRQIWEEDWRSAPKKLGRPPGLQPP